jgi:NADH-quinone oxidoreductase subunit K
MTAEMSAMLWPFITFTVMLFVIGVYNVLMTHNIIRVLIGLELLIKAATLLIIAVGYSIGRLALTQEMVITLIVIEVVTMVVAAGVVVGPYKHDDTLDVRSFRNLKG